MYHSPFRSLYQYSSPNGSGALLDQNCTSSKIKTRMSQGRFFVYTTTSTSINGTEICKVLRWISNLRNYYGKSISLPVILDFKNAIFVDKLTYIVLECIYSWLKYECRYNIRILLGPQHGIAIDGFDYSPLNKFSTSSFPSLFQRTFDLSLDLHHYRRLVRYSYTNSKTQSIINSEISDFFSHANIDIDCADDVAEVVVELLGNASEHCSADCIIDIDISEQYLHISQEGKFRGVNIVVANFSDNLLYSAIKSKFYSSVETSSSFLRLAEALINHKAHFSSIYDETDFFMLSAFQNQISGRSKKYTTGGTGLTMLIKSLQARSESDNCYVMSGQHVIYFRKQLLTLNPEKWVGFNLESDFINYPPHSSVVARSNVYFPGTAYNLNFVMKEVEKND